MKYKNSILKKAFSIKCLFRCPNLTFCAKIGLKRIYTILKCFTHVFELCKAYSTFFPSWKNDKDCSHDKSMLCTLDEYSIDDTYIYLWPLGQQMFILSLSLN